MPSETQTERRARQRHEEELRREEKFSKARNAQASYGAALRQYARQIANIIRHYAEGNPPVVPPHVQPALTEALRRYREGTRPWATSVAWRMLKEVERRNLTAWRLHASNMSIAIRQEIYNAPIGDRMLELLDEQVKLITSLPTDAAQRVHETTVEALAAGTRYQQKSALEVEGMHEPPPLTELEEALAAAHPSATEAWLRNKATLIARTETARSASVLVQARSEYIGAEEYEWLTAGDWKVRPGHRHLNHTRQRWDDPPLSDPPDYHSHPGQIFNCRCTAIPIIPD